MLSVDMRPQTLSEYIGNDKIREFLQKAFEENKVPQSLLFIGHFGCGKTTIARITAHMLDAEAIEHDCGSNSDINDIRALIEGVNLNGFFKKKKVYILDEVQKLSKPAQDVLLKSVEEPPEDVYFILCTSEPDKIIKPLKSRCVTFEIEKASFKHFKEALSQLQKRYKITFENIKDMNTVVEHSDGSLRQFYNIMEKAFNIAGMKGDSIHLTTKTLMSALDVPEELNEESNLPKAVFTGDLLKILTELDNIKRKGTEQPFVVLLGLHRYFMKVFLGGRPQKIDLKKLLKLTAGEMKTKDISWESLEYIFLSWLE